MAILTRNRTLQLAAAAVCLTLFAMLGVESVRKTLKSIPGYTFATVVIFNALNDPVDPSDVGNGKSATEITLQNPGGLAMDHAGNIYVSDRIGFVWKIDNAGKATIIAGTGHRGLARDGGRAIETDLGSPEGLAFDSRERLHFADSINNAIFRIEADGTLHRVAGNGRVGDRGDGRAAIRAALYRPFEIRFDSKDNLYIVDVGNNKIRKVDDQGIITTVAGTGKAGYSGDDGPATGATLREPYGVYLDAQDQLLIADSANNVVRLVDADGIIRTIAGTAARGYAGDGGPARSAQFNSPQFLYVDGHGAIFVGDEHNNAIRVIDRSGSIATVVGAGAENRGNFGTRSKVSLNDPEALLVQPNGAMLILDGDNHRVIRIRPNGEAERFAGAAGEEGLT